MKKVLFLFGGCIWNGIQEETDFFRQPVNQSTVGGAAVLRSQSGLKSIVPGDLLAAPKGSEVLAALSLFDAEVDNILMLP